MDEEVRRVTGRVCSQQRADCGGTTRSALRTRGEAEPATFGARRGRRVVSADLRHSWADAAVRRHATVQPAGPRRPPRPWKGRSHACRAVPGAPPAWVARSTSLETRFETIFSYAMGYELIFLLLLQLNSQSIIWNCMTTFLGDSAVLWKRERGPRGVGAPRLSRDVYDGVSICAICKYCEHTSNKVFVTLTSESFTSAGARPELGAHHPRGRQHARGRPGNKESELSAGPALHARRFPERLAP